MLGGVATGRLVGCYAGRVGPGRLVGCYAGRDSDGRGSIASCML